MLACLVPAALGFATMSPRDPADPSCSAPTSPTGQTLLPDICIYDGMPAMSFLQNDLAAVLSSKSEPALEDLEAALETTTALTRASFDVVYTPENGDEKAAFEANFAIIQER